MKLPFPRSPRLLLALEFLLYAVLTALMLHATWLTWPDAFIDFSRELYLPWRVSCGDVLYRDLAYYFGPLSVYTNAALFALLGRPSIHALFALNFAFWAATLLALRAILRRIASPFAAVLSLSCFILLFSFSRYTGLGNDNFLAPYSHEITRGFLFALLVLLSLDFAHRRFPEAPPFPRFPVPFLLPGILCALVLFTKPELALASTVSLALLFALHAWQRRSFPFRPLLAFSLGTLATIALVVAPFALALHSLSKACHDTLLRIYLDCFNTDLTSLPYFKAVLGTDHVVPNAGRLFLGALLAFLPFLLCHLLSTRLSSRALNLATVLLLALAAMAVGWLAWSQLNAAIPLAPVLFAAFSLWEHRRSAAKGSSSEPRNPNWEDRLPLALAFAAFAFLLSSKILLNAHIWHYGFVLSLPAFCCAVLLVFRSPCPPRRAVVASALLGAFLAGGLAANAVGLRHDDIRHPIFDGTYLAAPVKANAFNAALSWIRANTPPDSTLAVLPEGALLNVFSGRPNPTPYASLEQPACLRFESPDILSAFSNSPPDTLVLVLTDPPRFGLDYAQDLLAFLNPLYAPAFTIYLPAPASSIPCILIARKN